MQVADLASAVTEANGFHAESAPDNQAGSNPSGDDTAPPHASEHDERVPN